MPQTTSKPADKPVPKQAPPKPRAALAGSSFKATPSDQIEKAKAEQAKANEHLERETGPTGPLSDLQQIGSPVPGGQAGGGQSGGGGGQAVGQADENVKKDAANGISNRALLPNIDRKGAGKGEGKGSSLPGGRGGSTAFGATDPKASAAPTNTASTHTAPVVPTRPSSPPPAFRPNSDANSNLELKDVQETQNRRESHTDGQVDAAAQTSVEAKEADKLAKSLQDKKQAAELDQLNNSAPGKVEKPLATSAGELKHLEIESRKRDDEKAPPADDAVADENAAVEVVQVIEIVVPRLAWESGAFDALLASQQIVCMNSAPEAPSQVTWAIDGQPQGQTLALRRSVAVQQSTNRGRSAPNKKEQTVMQDGVYVEATAAQVQAVIQAAQAQPQVFYRCAALSNSATVAVEPAPGPQAPPVQLAEQLRQLNSIQLASPPAAKGFAAAPPVASSPSFAAANQPAAPVADASQNLRQVQLRKNLEERVLLVFSENAEKDKDIPGDAPSAGIEGGPGLADERLKELAKANQTLQAGIRVQQEGQQTATKQKVMFVIRVIEPCEQHPANK